MIIPWRVDVPQERRPIVNYLFVVVIIIVFVWEVSSPIEKIEPYILSSLSLKGLFGHIWLHCGIFHLLGNALFLWIFGNAVCAKVGNLFYPAIYIFIGILAGLIQLAITGGAIIGASGAITGIVGIYLVYFWENDITCYWIWFPFVRGFTVSSFWMILLWIFYDIVGVMLGGYGVGYFAHLSGYAAGFGIAVVLLQTGVIKMERYERSLLERFGLDKSRSEEQSSLGRLYGGFAQDLEYLNSIQTQQPTEAQQEQLQPPEKISLSQLQKRPAVPPEQFIRLQCSCGKRLKVPAKFAGRVGSCPVCKKRIRIPSN
jgi:membrane associated rhomboid family serine protease